MLVDYFSLRDLFEKKTNLNYDDFTGFQKVWRTTKTYRGESMVDPYGMLPIAKHLLETIEEPDDAILAFYFFVNNTTSKEISTKKDIRGKPILSHFDTYDMYDMRTLVKGKGICNQIAAEVLGLCRSVGIPSIFHSLNKHGYVDVWTNTSGWKHIGYKEGILSKPDTEILKKYVAALISDSIKKEKDIRKISDGLVEFSENLKKYGFYDGDISKTLYDILLKDVGLNNEIINQLLEPFNEIQMDNLKGLPSSQIIV
ncbi:MAG: transglutaminase domain-containing protein [Candidatus Aenigmarchaeota archaeon]|nr:transglutaminase domain-containing protein [Candidatus Aenigmarchaeota archaeon]